jgi:hypothetical protein
LVRMALRMAASEGMAVLWASVDRTSGDWQNGR